MLLLGVNKKYFLFIYRTGSKLGISPLMLAAMNGHTLTVKLLLDFGSDINAQVLTSGSRIRYNSSSLRIKLFE